MSATLLFFKQAITKILNGEEGSNNVSLSFFSKIYVDLWKCTFPTFLKILPTLSQSERQKEQKAWTVLKKSGTF